MIVSRKRAAALLKRWLNFNAVGAMGICVQLLAVYLFGSVLVINSLWATALAVEATVLHNFVWHQHFTWTDRRALTRRHILLRLLGFNATTGAVSIAGNLLFVSLLMRAAHAPLLAANLFAAAACSLVNFVVNEKIVFRGPTTLPQTVAPLPSLSVRADPARTTE
jgi:putative flippase GtrA